MNYLYVVINDEGKFYGRFGWCIELKDAKIFKTISTARSRVTSLANSYAEHPTPKIGQIPVNETMVIIDETERVAKAKSKKEKFIVNAKIRESKRRLKEAQQEVEKAQLRLEQMKGVV